METMKEQGMQTCPLSMDAEWCPLVNNRADKAEENRQKRMSWAEQQKANRKAERRARRILYGIMVGLGLIVFGGVAMNYVEGFPFPAATAIAIIGVAAYMFTVGWVIGHRTR